MDMADECASSVDLITADGEKARAQASAYYACKYFEAVKENARINAVIAGIQQAAAFYTLTIRNPMPTVRHKNNTTKRKIINTHKYIKQFKNIIHKLCVFKTQKTVIKQGVESNQKTSLGDLFVLI